MNESNSKFKKRRATLQVLWSSTANDYLFLPFFFSNMKLLYNFRIIPTRSTLDKIILTSEPVKLLQVNNMDIPTW